MKTKVLFTALVGLGLAGFSLSPAHGQIQPVQKTTTSKQVTTVRRSITPVLVSAADLKNIKSAMPLQNVVSSKSLPGVLPIDVTSPKNEDIWEAGKEYVIKWAGAKEDVRIDLESVLSTGNQSLTQVNIVGRAPNTGSYKVRIPSGWLINPFGYRVKITTLSGKQSGYSTGTIAVFTQPYDLECDIIDAQIKEDIDNYGFYIAKQSWFEFNVLMRNKGVNSPVTIRQVLVRIIKEPRDIVVYQEEWGFSGIHYHNWYQTPDPVRIDISSSTFKTIEKEENINLKQGSYRVEVELDQPNLLGENQLCRADNKCVKRWVIK